MYSIGQASRFSGVNPETIRYYERKGIVTKPGRTESGRRAYNGAEVARLRFVRRCRDLGFPLEDIQTLLGFANENNKACSEVKMLSERHLQHVRQKVQDLVELEKALSELVNNCSGGKNNCPMLGVLLSEDF